MIDESKIREKAYELWEKDGRPEGSEQFYWRLAQDQLGAVQQRKFDQVMQAQGEVMALYEQARPVSLADELKAVATS